MNQDKLVDKQEWDAFWGRLEAKGGAGNVEELLTLFTESIGK